MNFIHVTEKDKSVLKDLYDDSALTIEGLDYEDESMQDFVDIVDGCVGLKTNNIYVISGKVMNKVYRLTGDNRYPDDLHIVSIKLSDMKNPSEIIMKRFEFGGRWFDDIVDNNKRREKEKHG